MADINMMATNIKNNLSQVPGIKSAYDHEPQTISQLPAATLYFDSFSLDEGTTRRASVNWHWLIRLYVPLNTSDVKSPQLQVRDFIMNTIKHFRTDISLGNSCLFHTISNGDVSAVLDQNNPMMVVELTITATTEEYM
jgi:VanZ family protein